MQTSLTLSRLRKASSRFIPFFLALFLFQEVNGQTSGYTPGAFDVSNTGGATYSIPIIVSPGTGQLEPKLAFIYGSQSPNGIMGPGWGVSGTSAITRTGQQTDPDGDNTAICFCAGDKASIDGDRMFTTGPNYWQGGNTYFSEHNRYAQIQSFGNVNGSPQYYVVKTKDGLTMEYGRTSDSRIEAAGTSIPIRWLVNKIYDNKGNYMLFHYQEINATGESYPTSIEYTGNEAAGLQPYNKVEFEYESRPDISTGYVNQTVQKLTKRLKAVHCYHMAEIIRSYELTYKQSGVSNRSLLTNIQECGENGTCLNATQFEYSESDELQVEEHEHPLPIPIKWKNAKHIVPVDLNGDGISDYAFQQQESVKIILGNRNYGTQSSSLINGLSTIGLFGINPFFGDNDYIDLSGSLTINSGVGDIDTLYDFIISGDFNGDGKMDLVLKQYQHLECYISQCDDDNISFIKGFDEENGALLVYDRAVVGDFDGNGKDDLMLYTKYGATLCYYFLSSTVQYSVGAILPNFSNLTDDTTYPEMTVTDWNGDGIDDILVKGSEGSGYKTRIYRGKSNKQFSIVNTPNLIGNLDAKAVFFQPIDLNNDGLPEIVRSSRTEIDDVISVKINDFRINRGAFNFGSELSINVSGSSSKAPYASPFFADINLDGFADIVTFPFHVTHRHCRIYYGNGNGFDSGILLDVPSSLSSYKNLLIPGRYFTTPGINLMAYNGDTGNNYFTEIYTEPKFLLTKITTGHGQQTDIVYQPITKDAVYQPGGFTSFGPYNHYRGPLYVVAYVTQQTNNGTLQGTSYKYEGAAVGTNGRGFRGFAKMTVTNANRNIKTVNYFRHDHRYGGNSLYASLTYAQDVLTSRVFYGHEVDAFQNNIFSAQIIYSQEESYDPITGVLLTQVVRTFDYDDFGNAVSSVSYFQDGRIDSLSNVYLNNTNEWKLGRLLASTRIVKAPDGSITQRSSAFEYDEDGWLEREITEPGNDTIQMVKAYDRDDYGNIIKTSETGWNGDVVETRVRTSEFDPLGRFPVATYIEGAFPTTYINDTGTGKPLQITDFNGLKTKLEYDDLMRPKKEVFPDGNWREYQYLLVDDPNIPTAVHVRIATDSKGNSSTTYFDLVERVVREEALRINEKIVVKDYVYDQKGDLIKVSLPYFKGGNPKWIIRKYDGPGRLIFEELPDGAKRTITYSGLESTRTNELGQTTTVISDIHGNNVEVIDNTGGAVTKKFDINGNVIEVISNHPTIRFTYDLRNLLVRKDDPSAGISTYRYNAFGELIEKTTPNGKSTYGYDKLGRPVEQIDGNLTSTYLYDTKFIGKLTSVSKSNFYSVNFDYDSLGNVVKETKFILDRQFITETAYNDRNEVKWVKYPSPNGLQLDFDYLQGEITGVKYGPDYYLWQYEDEDAFGNITTSKYGNGITVSNTFNANRGWMIGTKAWNSTGVVQDWQFSYNKLGNLVSQRDERAGKEEDYYYDPLNQLRKSVVVNGDSVTVQFNGKGQIVYKSDVGSYLWNDGNGRLDSIILNSGVKCPAGMYITYNAFGKVETVIKDSVRLDIIYGSDYQRIAQKLWINGALTKTRYYLGLSEIDVTADGLQTAKDYIFNGREVFAVQIFNPLSPAAGFLYLHKNHLGSTVALSNPNGEIIETLHYDAWGKRRSADWTALDYIPPGLIDRGFTGHEHYDLFELIDMNGRVYDPNFGVFLSPDPVYQSLDFNHMLNRYSYVYNNPLNLTDPTGYWGWDWDWVNPVRWVEEAAEFIGDNWKDIVTIGVSAYVGFVVTGVVTVATFNPALGAIAGGAAAGFVGGMTGSLLNGQSLSSSLKAGLRGAAIGAVSAGLTYGVGHGLVPSIGGGTFAEETVRTVGHGVVQGGVSELNGGSFLSGFASGAISSSASSAIGASGWNPGTAGNIAISATVGGTVSQLTGGNFANGAMSGAFVYMFNHALEYYANKTMYWTLETLSDVSAGFADRITLGGTKYMRENFRFFGMNGVDDVIGYDSWSYAIGESGGDAWLATTAELGVARAFGYTSKIALHDAHHTFGSFGKLSHIQINYWKIGGTRATAGAIRFPLPWR